MPETPVPDPASEPVDVQAALLQAEAELRRLRDQFAVVLGSIQNGAAKLQAHIAAQAEHDTALMRQIQERDALIAKQNGAMAGQTEAIRVLNLALTGERRRRLQRKASRGGQPQRRSNG